MVVLIESWSDFQGFIFLSPLLGADCWILVDIMLMVHGLESALVLDSAMGHTLLHYSSTLLSYLFQILSLSLTLCSTMTHFVTKSVTPQRYILTHMKLPLKLCLHVRGSMSVNIFGSSVIDMRCPHVRMSVKWKWMAPCCHSVREVAWTRTQTQWFPTRMQLPYTLPCICKLCTTWPQKWSHTVPGKWTITIWSSLFF